MPLLKFEIEADFDKVVKLRKEIDALEKQLRSFDGSTTRDEMQRVQAQLTSAKGEFTKLTTAAQGTR